MTVGIRIRSTSTNANRVLWATKYIRPEALAAGEMPRYAVQWITSLLQACEMMPQNGIDGRTLNVLFPPKGQPGAQSMLVGKSVVADIKQKDNFYEGKMERKDEVEAFLPARVS